MNHLNTLSIIIFLVFLGCAFDRTSCRINTFKTLGPGMVSRAELQPLGNIIFRLLKTESLIAHIYKQSGRSHTEPNDFRAISLSSFLLKTFEKLIDCYLRKSIGQRNIVLSTETALHVIVGSIEGAFNVK